MIETTGRLLTWTLRGRTYVPVSSPTLDPGLDLLDEARADSMTDEGGPAPAILEPGAGGQGKAKGVPWRWDLSRDKVQWGNSLHTLFGYAETVTDAAWREQRIHPEDRERVKASLERATITNYGAQWSEEFRFRRADGTYAAVTERAHIVSDQKGPREVVGALTPGALSWRDGPDLAEEEGAGCPPGHTARTEEVP